MNHFVEAALQARHSLKESDQAEVAHGRDVVVSSCRRKTAQNDARDTARRPGQFCGDRTDGDTGGAIGRKAIDTGSISPERPATPAGARRQAPARSDSRRRASRPRPRGPRSRRGRPRGSRAWPAGDNRGSFWHCPCRSRRAYGIRLRVPARRRDGWRHRLRHRQAVNDWRR